MIRLSCEACGSIDLKKEGEYYVCQHCGSKYTFLEYERRMKRLEILYKEARTARAADDSITARKHYDLLVKEDPENWEAVFFSAYYRIAECRLFQIENASDELTNVIKNVGLFKLGPRCENGEISEQEYKSALTTITRYTLALTQSMFATSLHHFNEFHSDNESNYGFIGDSFHEYGDRVSHIVLSLRTLGTILKHNALKENGKDLAELGVECDKAALQMVNDYYTRNLGMFDNILSDIQKYEPNYQAPEVDKSRFSNAATWVALRGAELANKNKKYEPGSKEQLSQDLKKLEEELIATKKKSSSQKIYYYVATVAFLVLLVLAYIGDMSTGYYVFCIVAGIICFLMARTYPSDKELKEKYGETISNLEVQIAETKKKLKELD